MFMENVFFLQYVFFVFVSVLPEHYWFRVHGVVVYIIVATPN